jgi:hypothetical protein
MQEAVVEKKIEKKEEDVKTIDITTVNRVRGLD